MASVPEKTRIIWLGEPPDTSEELLLFLTHELHISPKSSSRIFVLRDIRGHLLKLHNEGSHCLLIMDEVHKISDDVLECVRLLNNLELGSIKLIQMLLIGQEEFIAKLSQPNLESFKQRIAWFEAIGKMTLLQTHEYIMYRLKVAGSQLRIFTDEAIEAVAGSSRGTPRLVNTLCDRALRVSYESNKTIVDLDSVKRAADEIGLGSEVSWWLFHRRGEKMAQNAALQASSLEDNFESAASDPERRETTHVNKIHSAPRAPQDNSSWMFPMLLLCVSILLFAASIWFYMIHT